MLTYFAGFYCSPDEKAAYADDKIFIHLIAVAILVASIFWASRVKRTWQTVLIILAGVVLALGTWIYLQLSWIPWGC